jgi:hypothetical protein
MAEIQMEELLHCLRITRIAIQFIRMLMGELRHHQRGLIGKWSGEYNIYHIFIYSASSSISLLLHWCYLLFVYCFPILCCCCFQAANRLYIHVYFHIPFFFHLFFSFVFHCIYLSISELRPRNTRHSRQQLGRRFIFYSLYAWGVPFIIVLVGQILDNIKNLPPNIVKPGFGQLKCWFLSKFIKFYLLSFLKKES